MSNPTSTANTVDGHPAAPGGHYSHATAGAGMVFTAGQLPIDASGKPRPELDFAAQTELALRNVAGALASQGCGWGDVLKVTVYLAGVEHWPEFNKIYAATLGDHRPARSVVPVPALHYDLLVEIEAVAAPRTAKG